MRLGVTGFDLIQIVEWVFKRNLWVEEKVKARSLRGGCSGNDTPCLSGRNWRHPWLLLFLTDPSEMTRRGNEEDVALERIRWSCPEMKAEFVWIVWHGTGAVWKRTRSVSPYSPKWIVDSISSGWLLSFVGYGTCFIFLSTFTWLNVI